MDKIIPRQKYTQFTPYAQVDWSTHIGGPTMPDPCQYQVSSISCRNFPEKLGYLGFFELVFSCHWVLSFDWPHCNSDITHKTFQHQSCYHPKPDFFFKKNMKSSGLGMAYLLVSNAPSLHHPAGPRCLAQTFRTRSLIQLGYESPPSWGSMIPKSYTRRPQL